MQYILSCITNGLIGRIIVWLANENPVVDNRHGNSQHGLKQNAVVAKGLRKKQVEDVLLSVSLYLRGNQSEVWKRGKISKQREIGKQGEIQGKQRFYFLGERSFFLFFGGVKWEFCFIFYCLPLLSLIRIGLSQLSSNKRICRKVPSLN